MKKNGRTGGRNEQKYLFNNKLLVLGQEKTLAMTTKRNYRYKLRH
jgi:hypothetical protein